MLEIISMVMDELQLLFIVGSHNIGSPHALVVQFFAIG
jgi:hypothetical protein